MYRISLFVMVSFVVGVGVGGLAFGQRPAPTPPLLEMDLETEVPSRSGPDSDPSMAQAAPESRSPTDVAEAEGVTETNETEIVIGGGDEAGRLLAMEARWSSLATQLERLSRRVIDLEQRLAEPSDESSDADDASVSQALPIDTPEERRNALILAGVEQRVAEDIVLRESEIAMERLDLRDRAAREGWLDSERYIEELSILSERAVDLRNEVGDAAFDRFLYETGQANRVAVASVMAGSQGELAGILPGDIIEDYAGQRVFDFNDLRSATTAGTRDETVPVTIRRGDRFIETWLARGPIGVSLRADSASPDW